MVENYLLQSPSWVRKNVLVELVGEKPDSERVQLETISIINDPQISILLEQIESWPGGVLKSHNDSSHLIHKLAFLADIGLDISVPQIVETVHRITEHCSIEGLFQVQVNIPKHFGGSGEEQWSWMLCDAPLILYSLKKLGYADGEKIKIAVEYLLESIKNNGWPCKVSPDLGKFRGPGKKDDPCPYATLLMLKLLSLFDEYKNTPQAHAGTEALLSLWEKRKELRPYMFAMGSGFQKLKAPFVWYDILHVADVLTQYNWLLQDERLLEMIEIIRCKADEEGLYKAESAFKAWRAWEFGQKKVPSRWITYKVMSILNRLT